MLCLIEISSNKGNQLCTHVIYCVLDCLPLNVVILRIFTRSWNFIVYGSILQPLIHVLIQETGCQFFT